VKLRYLAAITVSNVDKKSIEGETPVRLCNYMDVYNNARIGPEHDFAAATASPEQIRKFTLRAGDVLITKDSETPDDIGVPAYVTTDLPNVLCGYHLAILRPRPSAVDGRYLYWAVAAEPTRRQFDASAFGITRFGLRQDAISDTIVPLPDLRMQRAIADLLDAETARLDQLLNKYQVLTSRLEIRLGAALWLALVGTGPKASTWIPLKHVVSYREGPGILAADFREAGVPLLRIVNLVQGSIELEGCGWLDPDHVQARWQHLRVKAGELVVSGSGSSGLVAVVPPEADGAVPYTGLIRIWPRTPAITRDYLEAFLASDLFLDQVESLKAGVAIQHWGPSHLDRVRLPLPSIGTQEAVAAAWKRHRERTKELIATIERQMRLLQERRRALITAAVTGQLSAPGAA
jgi:type I restriction enzyme, S subunit